VIKVSLNPIVQPGFRAAEAAKPASAPIQGKPPSYLNPKQAAAQTKEVDGFSFFDLIDIVNPLQHIPVVNTVYRAVTGDKINNFSRVAGGALFGGLAGAAIGLVNVAVKDGTGKDIGELAMNKMGFRKDATAAEKEKGPVIDVYPLAENVDTTIAMPQPKSLNEIAPLSGFSQNVSGEAVPSAMMDALIKYQAMQNMTPTEENEPDTAVRDFRRSLRHYNTL